MQICICALRDQVQQNCNVSDARYGALFSVCGLLLRMRDLFKWEQNMPPWQEPEPAVLLEWIEQRETGWLDLTNRDFHPIRFGDTEHPAFETDSLNRQLLPIGLVYGAGYAALMKPSFLLGQIVRSDRQDHLTIHVIDRELARDLFTTPAMRQGDTIFARRDAMRFFLWDQIMQRCPSTKTALQFACNQYGYTLENFQDAPHDHRSALQTIAHQELDHWVFHEVGEARETTMEGSVWQQIVATFAASPIEIYARALKDLLADTHPAGFLEHVTKGEHTASVGFYVAFMSPFTKALFPEMLEAFRTFRLNGDWQSIHGARVSGFDKARRQAGTLAAIFRESASRGTQWAKQQILAELIQPLEIL